MTTIRLQELSKYYGWTAAVDKVDLQIKSGDFTVLVGPSGCGKTTTLRMIAGLETPSAGDIYFNDQPVTARSPRDRDVAVVFQHYSLYGHLNVRENLTFGLKARKTSPAIIAERLQQVTDLLRIGHLLDRRPGQLSGGEQQRVAIGRALARKPRVFLFDEPLSNLDAALRLELRTEMIRLHQTIAATAVYVTHDQAEAMSMADTLVVMAKGKVLQSGPPLSIYQQPADTFVARFIGSPPMNLLPGEVFYENGELRFCGPHCRLPVSLPCHQRYFAGRTRGNRRFLLGLRPEHLSIKFGLGEMPAGEDRKTRGRGELEMEGTVATVENLGSESLLSVDCRGLPVRMVVPGIATLPVGTPLQLAVDPVDIHLFDQENKKNILLTPKTQPANRERGCLFPGTP